MNRVVMGWKFARGLVLGVVVFLAAILALGVATYAVDRPMLGAYLLAIGVPATLAVLTTLSILLRSEYMRIATELGRKRLNQRAGLGFVRSSSNKVLLARQGEYPWKGQWILPGGYVNPTAGDRWPQDTAQRRVRIAVGEGCSLVASVHVATTKSSPDYVLSMMEVGHQPVEDEVYLISSADGPTIDEAAIALHDNIRWFTADEISASAQEIPPHMRQLLIALLEKPPASERLRFWKVSRDYEDYLLQNLHPGGDK